MATQSEAFQRAYGVTNLSFYGVSLLIGPTWYLNSLSEDLSLSRELTATTAATAKTEAEEYLSGTLGFTQVGRWAEDPGQEFTSVWVNIPI